MYSSVSVDVVENIVFSVVRVSGWSIDECSTVSDDIDGDGVFVKSAISDNADSFDVA